MTNKYGSRGRLRTLVPEVFQDKMGLGGIQVQCLKDPVALGDVDNEVICRNDEDDGYSLTLLRLSRAPEHPGVQWLGIAAS
jgi:hypothetical protein